MWSIFSRSSLSSFSYDILELLYEDERSIWKIHKGKKKQGNEEVTIFVCEQVGETCIDMAKAAIKRLKMLKHPSILKFIDSLESDKSVYLVTEQVTPLWKWLEETEMSPKNQASVAAWGLLQITTGLSFINNDGKLLHHNIHSSSVFVTKGGEWKIFGLEYTSADTSYFPVKILPQLTVYDPPERHSGNNSQGKLWSTDIWGLGCLIWEVFNHRLDKSMSLQVTSKIPKGLLSTYCELVGANPNTRPNPQDVLDSLRKSGQFFRNDLIETLKFLDEIHIKDENEKHRFFAKLTSKLDNIPDFISKNKILPALLTTHEFANVGSVLLTPLFKIGHCLEPSEYQSQIVPCVVRMFSSTDRTTRLKLLQQMESLAEHLDAKTVNEQIFQPLVTGFQDTNPTIREHSVKAILFLAPKFNYNNLNVEILKHFARLQSRDDQGGIRTNTTVCLGKIASYLSPDTRQKCLVSAFTRAMKDPFPPARIAGVTAIGATQQFYPLTDVATKVLPALSMITMDPEKDVRNAVFKIFKGFLGKLEKVSEDPDLREVMEKEVSSSTGSSSAAATWAGWAVGALASKFYKGPLTSAGKNKEGVDSSSTSGPSTKSSSLPSSAETSKRTSPTREIRSPKGSTDGWGENWDEAELSKVIETTMNDVDISAGDGWGEDDEDWGSLEVEVPNSTENSSETKFESSTGSSQNDFFSSFEPSNTKSKMSSASSRPSASSNFSSWGSEGFNNVESNSSSDKIDEVRRQREERKAQRMKEIEIRRAGKVGPMKLGAKKL